MGDPAEFPNLRNVLSDELPVFFIRSLCQRIHAIRVDRLNGSGVNLKTASLQLIFDVLILGAALASAVDLLSRVDKYADGGQQVFLLLAVGPGLDPGNDAQGDPTGEERDLRLQDGGKINGVHVHHAPFFFSYSDFKAAQVMGPTMPSTSSW